MAKATKQTRPTLKWDTAITSMPIERLGHTVAPAIAKFGERGNVPTKSNALIIEYKTAIWMYVGVTADDYDELVNSDSFGRMLHAKVKNNTNLKHYELDQTTMKWVQRG